jgi:hypothetical protein
MKELQASAGFSGQLFHHFHLDILDFEKPLSLACQKMIDLLVEPVNLEFRVDAYLEITFCMEPVPYLLPVLAHDDDGGLDCGKDREDEIKQDERIGIERTE